MSQEAESGPIYEEPIDIPLEEEDDDEEDEVDEVAESHTPSTTQEKLRAEAEGHEDAEEDEDMDTIHANASRSGTSTPLGNANAGAGDDDEMEEEELDEDDGDEHGRKRDAQGKFKKYPKLDPAKAPPGKKVPLHLLEKRRLGRIKAAEEFARKLKQIGIEKVESNTLPPTGLFQPMILINQKNYSSDYLKKDEQVFALRDRKVLRNNTQVPSMANTPDVTDLKRDNGNVAEQNEAIGEEDIDLSDANTTMVIHPGSNSLKIGFAKDESPFVIPCCVAIPKSELKGQVPVNEEKQRAYNRDQPTEFHEIKSEIQHSFRERMRFYKRKVQPNAHEQVVNYNKLSKPELIEDKNDYNRVNWITNPDRRYYGEDALKCSKEHFVVRYPVVKGGSFNISSPDYRSLQDLMGDFTGLLEHVLRSPKFQLKRSQFTQYKVVLVIPDLFEKSHVETLIRCLITEMQFQAVAIIQESLATCYGAGISSSTCVVNVGATQTRVACVDEGTVLQDSCITLDYGSDDITKLFALFLLQSEFPYQDWDIESTHGWYLAEELKKKFTTFQDASVTVQLYNFVKRIPGQQAEKFDFKVFDEVILAPLSLFYPDIVAQLRNELRPPSPNEKVKSELPISRDVFTDNLDDWRSLSQAECLDNQLYCGNQDEFQTLCRILDTPSRLDELQTEHRLEPDPRQNYAPLEKAIVQSITNACLSFDISKMSSFYSNILVCGGGSNIPSFDFILTDRINIWRPRLLSHTSFPDLYKKLSKQIKDIKNSVKNGEGKSSGPQEDEQLKEKVREVIRRELERYNEHIESPNNVDHLLPVSVLPPPKDLDPSMLIWKGASVLAQIKLVEELYLTGADWDMHGSRILQYKCIFTY
ncbi:actin-like protein arp8 [Zygosaccharomyces mellis]|uniref:Actin-like protein arp8 n=1 Tax=Zygosaccharomyces mellis TaxID=42258 RepID=A0A4C2E0T8_9SACH|nr:actin-like protein arp8 [Zygosaccharomyces mellis]